jgi:divalent metal cation (Fe/Co/Zn/Cd) transporter
VDPESLAKLRKLAESNPGVEKVKRLLTMHFGPHTVLVTTQLQLHNGLSARDIEAIVDRLEKNMRAADPDIKHIFIEVKSIARQQREKSKNGTYPDRDEVLS